MDANVNLPPHVVSSLDVDYLPELERLENKEEWVRLLNRLLTYRGYETGGGGDPFERPKVEAHYFSVRKQAREGLMKLGEPVP